MLEAKPFFINIYSDNREVDNYAAWIKVEDDSYIPIEEQAEDEIYKHDELWSYLMDTHIAHYGDYNMDEEDEEVYQEWEDNIGAHATLVDTNDKELMIDFNSIELIIDQRNE